jgi:cyclic beta-1,2-glucan synthetase
LVVADYVKKTGDESILAAQAEYIASPPLTGENERYELPAKSFLSETVLLHCIRAFAAADKRGKHGLLLMGICDWNDAFSAVGAEGKGESVFSTFLFVVAAKAFLPLLRKENPESAAHLEQTAAELLKNAEETAFDGDRYLRAFCDDGHILGKAGNTECAVDILSQAFALFAGADKARCEIALQTAKKALYDPRHRILKLFDPPFDQGDTPAGYVRGYPPGVRENGGQYTHAAIWGAKAFLEIGDRETALEILAGANPLWRNASPKEAALYRSEAYAMCADIYGGQPAGRGGWSFYTGSGSWYYKVFLEDLLGIRLSAGNRILELYPRIPYRAVLRFHGRITIEVSPETEDTMDGTPVTFPIVLPDGEHKVTAKMR